jgi:predicted O-methyltransferase YrrM
LFNLYLECIRSAKKDPDDPQIEVLRKSFNRDKTLIDITDYGAGSKLSTKTTRTIRSIAHGGISTSKYSKLFQKLIRYSGSRKIVELGTSLGINTLYLARSAPDVSVWTFEGCSSIVDIASKVFSDFGCSNVEIIPGNIADTLPRLLNDIREIDFVLIDATHSYQATYEYFELILPKLTEKAVVIIDDIYWSKEMTSVWKNILQRYPEIVSIDIYHCGILIFDRSIQAERVKLAF